MENDYNRPYINFGEQNRKKSLVDKILPNKQTFNKVMLGLIIAIAAYGTKVHHETNKLSKSLTPLRNEYSRLVYSNMNNPVPDFTRKIITIQNARRQFAEDNGALDRPWSTTNKYDGNEIDFHLPSPLAYDIRKWFKTPDKSAVKQYLDNK